MAKPKKFRKWVNWNYQRPADVSVGKVIMVTSIYANTEDGISYMQGDVVDVAKALTTSAGLQYRIMGSTTWVGSSEAIGDSQAQLAARQNPDNIMLSTKFVNEFITPIKSDKIKTIENSTARVVLANKVRVISPNNVSNKEKKKHMDKSVLKSTIKGLVAGQLISLSFIGPKAHLTGDWTVVRTKTGKGKGGSKLMELVNGDQETITTGTPESQFILNLTVDGNMIGYASESDVPVVFEKNNERALELKTAFLALKGAEGNRTVNITATVPELTGTFTVNRQTQLRGRGGQIKLSLARIGSTETVEVWSLRHSGMIQSFDVVANETV